jgi:hypothetical protein
MEKLNITKEQLIEGELYADAKDTYNTTPILPSELLKQRNELLAALFELRNTVFAENDIRLLAASQTAKELINKINSEQ